jgi:hypothetical protein
MKGKVEDGGGGLTADGAVGLVGVVAAAVLATAGDGVRAAASVGALEGAVAGREAAAVPGAAGGSRLVAAVPAGDHRVAELVGGQTLAVVAAEGAFRTLCGHRRGTSLATHSHAFLRESDRARPR